MAARCRWPAPRAAAPRFTLRVSRRARGRAPLSCSARNRTVARREAAPVQLIPAAVPRSQLPRAAALVGQSDTRVLVVEDEPTVARLIGDVLEDEGLHVDVLLDGREALERAAREVYDLVICDMKMPGLDGQHFYERWLHREIRCGRNSCSSPEM